jgi:surface antigen
LQNLADTLNAQVEFAATADEYVAKPQIVATDVKTKDDITVYVAKEGDTISSIAAQFNITSDTLRWTNGLTGDAVNPGTELTILPVSGILHTVTESDSIASIASQYSAVKEQIVAFNDLELTGLVPGSKVVVPNGARAVPVQAPSYFDSGASSTASSGFAFGDSPLYGGNGYSYGYCTWHAANRRNDIGRPIPRNLGNAVTWASIASAAGLGVGEVPQTGAVLWHKNSWIAGGYGHVAFVEQVNPDGTALISDMNYPIWGGVTYRTITPGEFSQYLFIY